MSVIVGAGSPDPAPSVSLTPEQEKELDEMAKKFKETKGGNK